MTRTTLPARILPATIVALLLSGLCFSQISVKVSPTSGPPTSKTLVSGTGFTPDSKIGIYFDSTLVNSTDSGGSGSFTNVGITVPASATPGQHWVSAQESGGTGGRALFGVNTNWSMFGFTPEGVRWNPYENQLSTGTVGNLGLAWSSNICGGWVCSSPAVVNGVLYVGSPDGNVYALNAATGAMLWSFTTVSESISSPAVANGLVYAGASDYNLYALNATTGAKKWSFKTGGAVGDPTVANGVVYAGSYDGNVYALNAKTGARLWSFTASNQGISSPVVANGVVYAGSSAALYALNAATGAQLWSFPTFVIGPTPVVNGVVYVTSDDGPVYALNATTGIEKWRFTGQAEVSSPAVANGVVYLYSDGTFALDAATGAELWNSSMGSSYSAPAVANGVVYISSGNGYIFALDAGSGAELLSLREGSPVAFSSPTVVNGMLYVAFDATLYSFSLPEDY